MYIDQKVLTALIPYLLAILVWVGTFNYGAYIGSRNELAQRKYRLGLVFSEPRLGVAGAEFLEFGASKDRVDVELDSIYLTTVLDAYNKHWGASIKILDSK